MSIYRLWFFQTIRKSFYSKCDLLYFLRNLENLAYQYQRCRLPQLQELITKKNMLWLVHFHHQVFYFNFSYWFVTTTRYCSFLVFLLIVIPVCQFMQSIMIMTVILFSIVHSNLDYVNEVYSVTKTDYIKIINEYVRWQKITFLVNWVFSLTSIVGFI